MYVLVTYLSELNLLRVLPCTALQRNVLGDAMLPFTSIIVSSAIYSGGHTDLRFMVYALTYVWCRSSKGVRGPRYVAEYNPTPTYISISVMKPPVKVT